MAAKYSVARRCEVGAASKGSNSVVSSAVAK